jgi:hypothetical protein
MQLRRRLRSGFTATLLYTYSKSIDDDAALGGQGHVTASEQNQSAAPASTAIAQNWRDPRAERALSTFDQRHLLNLTLQYTSGQGLGGGDLMGGWSGRILKEWTVLTTVTAGTGLPETPTYLAPVPGTGFIAIRPSLKGTPIYSSGGAAHVNQLAFTAPALGQWGTAGRDSIKGPSQFTLNSSLERTFRPTTKLNLIARMDATNILNHAVFAGWNLTVPEYNPQTSSPSINPQFGLPSSANSMRSLTTTIRLRF